MAHLVPLSNVEGVQVGDARGNGPGLMTLSATGTVVTGSIVTSSATGTDTGMDAGNATGSAIGSVVTSTATGAAAGVATWLAGEEAGAVGKVQALHQGDCSTAPGGSDRHLRQRKERKEEGKGGKEGRMTSLSVRQGKQLQATGKSGPLWTPAPHPPSASPARCHC